MPLLPLSSIKHTNPELYKKVHELRDAIYNKSPAIDSNTAKDFYADQNIARIMNILDFHGNKTGDLYKYYFDEPSEVYGIATGNNILLDIIAQGCFVDNKSYAEILFSIVIENAKAKLTPKEISEFASFEFKGDVVNEYYYDNTPLTLAIKAGLISEAISLLDLGANPNASCKTYGGFTAIQLTLARLPYSSNSKNELDLLKILVSKGGNLSQEDSYQHTALSYLFERIDTLHAEDAPYFRLSKKIFPGADQTKKLSLKQILSEPQNNNILINHGFDLKSIERIDVKAVRMLKDFADKIKVNNEKIIYLNNNLEDANEQTQFLSQLFRHLNYDQHIQSSLKTLDYVLHGPHYQPDGTFEKDPEVLTYPAEDYFISHTGEVLHILGLDN